MQLSPHERVKPTFLPYTEVGWGWGQGYVRAAEPAPAKPHEAAARAETALRLRQKLLLEKQEASAWIIPEWGSQWHLQGDFFNQRQVGNCRN